jgi:hypothetical protein
MNFRRNAAPCSDSQRPAPRRYIAQRSSPYCASTQRCSSRSNVLRLVSPQRIVYPLFITFNADASLLPAARRRAPHRSSAHLTAAQPGATLLDSTQGLSSFIAPLGSSLRTSAHCSTPHHCAPHLIATLRFAPQLAFPHPVSPQHKAPRLNATFVLIRFSLRFVAARLSSAQDRATCHSAPLLHATHPDATPLGSVPLSATPRGSSRLASARCNATIVLIHCSFGFLVPHRLPPRLVTTRLYAAQRFASPRLAPHPDSPPFAATQRPSIPPGSAPRASSQHSTALHNATFFRLEMLS